MKKEKKSKEKRLPKRYSLANRKGEIHILRNNLYALWESPGNIRLSHVIHGEKEKYDRIVRMIEERDAEIEKWKKLGDKAKQEGKII